MALNGLERLMIGLNGLGQVRPVWNGLERVTLSSCGLEGFRNGLEWVLIS